MTPKTSIVDNPSYFQIQKRLKKVLKNDSILKRTAAVSLLVLTQIANCYSIAAFYSLIGHYVGMVVKQEFPIFPLFDPLVRPVFIWSSVAGFAYSAYLDLKNL